MYQGCDVWLNNPRRPQEACGTSGMKAAMNGALNCSILDGWWDECFDGTNGWAITSAEGEADLAKRDEIEANSLFELLERQIVPLFYQRNEGPTPRGWVRRMKASLRTLCPQVTAARMVRDYTTQLYEPTAAHADRINADDFAAAKALATWKERVLAAWHGVHVVAVESDVSAADLGATRQVDATVGLGDLAPDDVTVQLLHGPVGQGDELVDPAVVPMNLVEQPPAGGRYHGEFQPDSAGPLRLHRPSASCASRPRPARRAGPHRLGVIRRRNAPPGPRSTDCRAKRAGADRSAAESGDEDDQACSRRKSSSGGLT